MKDLKLKYDLTSQASGERLKGAQIIVECLIEQNVKYVFGYPGANIIDVFDSLYSSCDRITQILTSHEQGASHAADGYARATGGVGVVISTSGPGATNLVTGIATAYMDSVPLIAITGNVPLAFLGRDSFQEVDIAGITMPISKHNFIVKNIADLASTIRKAFMIAQSGRPGPVLIDIPKNIQQEFYEYAPQPAYTPTHTFMQEDDFTAKALQIINSAARPLLYIGGGCITSNASDILVKFAQKYNAPVASSLMGLGAFPASNPLFLGMIGMHGAAGVAKAMHEADTIVVIGARFSDRVACDRNNFCKHANIVQIDIDNAEIDKNVLTNAHILGDIKKTLAYLTANLKPQTQPGWAKSAKQFCLDRPYKSSPTLLCPRKILQSIAANSPDDQIIVTDVGQHQMFTAQSYPFEKPRTFLTSGGLGTMGFGLGAAIGAGFGVKKDIVLITGDGSLHMNMNELATAVKYNIPVKIFLFNNNTLGMVRQLQTLFYNKHYSSTTLDYHTNYAQLIQAFGGEAFAINSNDQIDSVVKQALASKLPTLVDCHIATNEFVLPMIPPGKSSDDIITDL